MPDINVAQILEALNSKVDLADGKTQADVDYVVYTQVPSAENNWSFVRLYKSGWVEQGGRCEISRDTATTVEIPVEMSNTNYQMSITASKPGSTQTGGDGNFTCDVIDEKHFYWRCGDDFTGVGYWEVRGFAKVTQ